MNLYDLADTMDWSDVGTADTDSLLLEYAANLSSPIAMATEYDRMERRMIRQAKDAFIEGRLFEMLKLVKRDWRWDFVQKNVEQLQARSMFEACLLLVHLLSWSCWTREQGQTIRRLFSQADRKRMMAAGNELPGDGPFTLYRGVCNDEGRDGVVGWSWTDRLDAAQFFAMHFSKFVAHWSGQKPTVGILKAVVPADEVFAYVGGAEREFIAQPRQFEPIAVEFDWTWNVKSVFGDADESPDRRLNLFSATGSLRK